MLREVITWPKRAGHTITSRSSSVQRSPLVSNGKDLAFIQVLRGVASLAVVLWHASRFISPYGSGLGTQLFEGGGVLGVDLFFIISGFIMVHTTAGADACSRTSVWNFFVKRFTRVWPVYLFWTVAYIACRYGFTEYLHSEPNRLRLLQSLTFIPFSNTTGGYDYPALNIGWTINYEAYFYLIFGLSMLFSRYRWHALWGWLLLSLVLLPQTLGHTPALSHTSYGLTPAYLNIVSDPIIWFFAAGMLIGIADNKRYRIQSRRWAWLAIGVAVALPLWQYVARFRIGHGVGQWGLSLIPLVLLLCLTQEISSRRGLAARLAIYLGNISYSLYLVHPLVQEHLEYLFHKWGAGRLASGFFFMGVTTVAAIGLAGLSHRWLENGLSNRLRNRLLIRKSPRPPVDSPSRAEAPDGEAPGPAWRRLLPLLVAIPLGLGLLAILDWERARTATTVLSRTTQTQGLWSDGWSACDFTLKLNKSAGTVTFWNASPMERHLTLIGGGASLQISFTAGEKKTLPLSGVVSGHVTPAFVPSTSDTRQLGLHIQFPNGG